MSKNNKIKINLQGVEFPLSVVNLYKPKKLQFSNTEEIEYDNLFLEDNVSKESLIKELNRFFETEFVEVKHNIFEALSDKPYSFCNKMNNNGENNKFENTNTYNSNQITTNDGGVSFIVDYNGNQLTEVGNGGDIKKPCKFTHNSFLKNKGQILLNGKIILEFDFNKLEKTFPTFSALSSTEKENVKYKISNFIDFLLTEDWVFKNRFVTVYLETIPIGSLEYKQLMVVSTSNNIEDFVTMELRYNANERFNSIDENWEGFF